MAEPHNLDRRVVMRLELFPHAKDRLEELCDRLGMTQLAAASRLMEWFAEQDDVVQAAVLGLYPEEIRAEVAAMILKRFGSKKKSRTTNEEK